MKDKNVMSKDIYSFKQSSMIKHFGPKAYILMQALMFNFKTYLSICLISKSIKNLFYSNNFSCSPIYGLPDDSISL